MRDAGVIFHTGRAHRAALFFCGQIFFKIRKTPPKGHCLRNFRRAIAGKQAILLTDNFLRRNLMRKPTKTERAVLALLRQGYRPKSYRAAIVSQLRNNPLASRESKKGV
jgi:hypothetical protein